jgi:hypothetical protein
MTDTMDPSGGGLAITGLVGTVRLIGRGWRSLLRRAGIDAPDRANDD